MLTLLSYLWNHKVGVVFFLFLLALIGTFGIMKIDKTMYPNTSLPQYNISGYWGTYSPETIELKVTAPIERAISKLKYVKGIDSRSRKGSASVTVYCDKDYEIYEFELLLNEAMRVLRDGLPENVSTRVTRTLPDEFSEGRNNSFLTYRVFSPYSLDSLSRLVENEIKTSLSSIPGVSEVLEYGLEKKAYFVKIRQEFRNMAQFSNSRISSAINSYFNDDRSMIGSVVRFNEDEFTIKFDEKFLTVAELRSIPIAKLNRRVMTLGEISFINMGPEIKTSLIRFNGLDGISLDIKRRPDASAIAAAELVKARIAILEKQYNLTTQLLTDEGDNVAKKLDDLFLRVLVSLVVIFFITFMITRQLYNSVVVMLLLILSGLFSIFGLYITGNSINLYTIGGLALGFGMIIDNSLIVIEKLSHIPQNAEYKEKVLLSIENIITPVKVSTYTTIGAILPVYVMDELLKITLSPFVIAVSFSLVASLLISVLFLPMLVRERKSTHAEYVPKKSRFIKGLLFVGRKRKTSLLLLSLMIGVFGIPFYYYPMPNQIEDLEWYNDIFNTETFKNDIKPAVNYAFGGALYVYVNDLKDKFSWGSYRSSGDDEKKSLSVSIRPPSGTKLEDINAIISEFEALAIPYVKGVDHIYTRVSASSAAIQVYFSDEQFNTLIPEELKDLFAQKTSNYGGLDVSISGVGDGIFIRGAGFSFGPQGEGAIEYELMGPSYDELKNMSDVIKSYLEANRRVKSINTTSSGFSRGAQTQMLMNYKKDLEPNEYDWINKNITGILHRDETNLTVSGLNGDERIYIQSENQTMETFNDYKSMVFLDDSMTQIKIANLGFLDEEMIQSTIQRRNQIYVRPISFEYRAAKKRVEAYQAKFESWVKTVLPEDIKLVVPETTTFAYEEGMETYVVVIITLLIVFAIVAMYFESYRYTFAVFTIIPFSLVGITYFFYMMDQAFDQDAIFGLMFVAGIVINNAAFVIYEIMLKRQQGIDMNSAVETTITERARPILLTTITTVVGILPLFLPQILMQVLPGDWIVMLNSSLPESLSQFVLKNSNTDSMWYAMSLATISGCAASFLFSLWIPVVLFWKREKKKSKLTALKQKFAMLLNIKN